MAERFTVIYTEHGGPYSIHQLGALMFPISHRGSGIPDKLAGHSEKDVINKIISIRKQRVAVHVYKTAVDKAIYIADFLRAKELLEHHSKGTPPGGAVLRYEKYFKEDAHLWAVLAGIKVYGVLIEDED